MRLLPFDETNDEDGDVHNIKYPYSRAEPHSCGAELCNLLMQ